ncbi:MAG TPA: NADH-quinone oxidoreductase subunit L [Anaerolineales bacterium]|nr:NADH-quinone oxidoreductase subunit L [Anaerolineales bacterium]
MSAESYFALAPLIIFLPVAGLLVNLALGRRLGERFTGIVASSAVGLGFGVAVLQFLALQAEPEGARVAVAEWIRIGDLAAPWALKIDSLAVTMLLMVTGVSTLIHIYAIGYMHADVRFQGDPGRYTRFFIYFNLFVAAMMVLVTGDSFLTLFVGWEGVGLCSYLLIGFWYEKGEGGIGNALAGKKAFVVNRIGDLGFLLAIFTAFWAFGSLRFDEVFQAADELGPAAAGAVTLITLFLLIGATGKSAQLPLFVWLPDAMAGPTPVSALIHAATMVTAGIYMIARTSPLFELAPGSANLVALVGAATALFAATIAVGQFDIKRVLAYSTISQLGFMISAVGIGAYAAGMFHLITHAFFKALLFLSAGSVIQGVERGHHHASHGGHAEHFDPNDMRGMGGLRDRMPVTFIVYLVGSLALAGIPPLAGFFSKDEILADAAEGHTAVYLLLSAAAFLTAFYIGRQVLMVFFGKPRSGAAEQAEESPAVMTGPLIALAVLAAVGGALNLPGLHSLTLFLEHTLEGLHPADFNPAVAGISTGLGLVALVLAWTVYGRKTLPAGGADPLSRGLGPLFTALNRKWWVDELYDWLFVRRYVAAAGWLANTLDGRFWHDWFHDTLLARSFRRGTGWLSEGFDLPVIDGAANGLAQLIQRAAAGLRSVQTGYVRNYAISVFIGLLLVMSYLLFR